IIEFLCKERDFSIDRVKKALERIKKKMKKVKTQASLDSWFG
ncbi:MAG: flap structure-specific endonuclease, partial [Candidatus Hydrothermarchaeota archaeon]